MKLFTTSSTLLILRPVLIQTALSLYSRSLNRGTEQGVERRGHFCSNAWTNLYERQYMGTTHYTMFGLKFRSTIHLLVAQCESESLLSAPDRSATDHPIF